MNNKTLYLECYSGISGDMTVAALLDLGADKDILMAGLNSLHVDGYKIAIGRTTKCSIDACDFDVILDSDVTLGNSHNEDHVLDGGHQHRHDKPGHPIHDNGHDHAHDHGHPHQPEHGHDHEHGHSHLNEHGHPHVQLHLGHHDHRNLYDINSIIDQSNITLNAKEVAKRIFQIVAVAESKAHGKPVEEVHFHEVGAIDSIVDIVAVAICLDNLDIKDVIVSKLYEGTGHITCQHGILPVPVPAVANIVSAHRLPLHITSIKGELVTPTGAAIVAAIRTKEALPKEFNVLKIGLGAGKRNYEQASILRAMLIEDTSNSTCESDTLSTLNITSNSLNSLNYAKFADTVLDKVWVLEANIDDCSGEVLSIAMELLFQNGAKDVYYTPIYMKKNRPAYLLGVICSEEKIEILEEIIFIHTTTIGIRKHECSRTTLKRELRTIATPYGNAIVKVCTYKDKNFFYPECDSIKKISMESGVDYITLYHLVQTFVQNLKSH